LSAAAQWSARLDGEVAVKKLAVPVLFLAAQGDTDFANDAQTLYRECASADKRLELVTGADHGTFMLSGSSGEGPRRTLLNFLQMHSSWGRSDFAPSLPGRSGEAIDGENPPVVSGLGGPPLGLVLFV